MMSWYVAGIEGGSLPPVALHHPLGGCREAELAVEGVRVRRVQEPAAPGVRSAVDALAHELDAQTASPELRQDVDVREIRDMAVGDRAGEPHLPPVQVQPDDARRPVDQLVLADSAPAGRPVRVIADELVDGHPVDAPGIVVELE